MVGNLVGGILKENQIIYSQFKNMSILNFFVYDDDFLSIELETGISPNMIERRLPQPPIAARVSRIARLTCARTLPRPV
jgi:hypothetical protein